MSSQVGRNERHALRTMPWWVAVIGTAVVAVSAAATTLWLLSVAGHDASLRIEAIKVGLSVGAGTGGAVALLLAVRRQWLSERTQAHTEDVARITQKHAEAVARDNAYDATQRRVTELYGKAVEQLGHANAPVRLGGLYSLERLAQDQYEHRQTVVDVICAYLRMPFGAASGPTDDRQLAADKDSCTRSNGIGRDESDAKEELQVRLAAQRLLARHLASPNDHRSADQHTTNLETYWAGMRIDLNGAHLVDFDFTQCRPDHADFRNAQFSGDIKFGGVQFSEGAGFDGARFGGVVEFDKACFDGDTKFAGAQFSERAGFTETQFSGEARFGGAQFSEEAEFNGAQFTGKTWFDRAEFSGEARFNGTQFSGETWFDRAQFSEEARFNGTQFSGETWFTETQFNGGVWFSKNLFSGVVLFGGSQFSGDAWFGGSRFSGDALFEGSQFNGDAWFGGSQFSGDASFERSQFRKNARFDGAEFSTQPALTEAVALHPNGRHSWPDGWQIEPSSAPGMAPLVQRR